MSEAFPLKYRPQYFDEVVGNKSTIAAIESILKKDTSKIPNSWLFVGESGCGKTTLARIVKEELGCEDMSFYEYNASNTRGIDTIRKIQEAAVLAPRAGSVKVYLLDEAHEITKIAQNALLKLLEDTPKNTYFFLATTNPEKLIKPIHSRCTTIKVSPVTSREMIPFIEDTLYEELGEEEAKQFPEDVLSAVAKNSNGACRDALKLLDMIIDMDDYDDMIDIMEQGVPQEGDLKELCDMLKSSRTQWKDMAKFLRSYSTEPEQTRRAVLGWFSSILLSDGSIRTAEVLEAFEDNYYDSGKAGLILSCFQVVNMQ